MKLSELLYGAKIIRHDFDPQLKITGIAIDSRNVRPGNLFAAIPGFKMDGHDFIAQAAASGAAIALTERWMDEAPLPQAQTPSVRRTIALAAANYYHHPSGKLSLIGVTGTNGKTTTTYIIDAILREAGRKTGLLGGIEYRLGDKSLPASRTTPEAVDLQAMLADMLDRGIDTATIEVSSHGIGLFRAAYLQFAVAVLTNISPEHRDLHHNMEEYYQTKFRLFATDPMGEKADSPASLPYAVINTDDEYGYRMAMELARCGSDRVLKYGMGEEAAIRAINIKRLGWKTGFKLLTPSEEFQVILNLPGDFNIYNALAAAATAYSLKIPSTAIIEGISSMKGVPGRFELLETGAPYHVVVDYAHNEDGLKKAIATARTLTSGRVIVVFGCPGERDRDKRPGMGRIAGIFADLAILTTDDCYSEPPELILDETETGLKMSGGKYIRIEDRHAAIQQALDTAKKGDTVLIAGKGHETRQILATGAIPFNDKETVIDILNG